MNKDSFFWKIMSGQLPQPRCAETLGLAFTNVDADKGTVEVEFQAKPEFLNPAGNIQGGFLAAMLDDTLGPALSAMLNPGEFAPTLNLNVLFHKPANVGVIKGIGRVIKKGRDVCSMQGELFQNDQLLASASATAIIRTIPAK